MSQVFKLLLGNFLIVYFDDVLIISRNEDKHFEYLRQVMMIIGQQKLCDDLKNCPFLTLELVFFKCIEVIMSLIHDVGSCHGLPSFYWRVIDNFSTIAALMTKVIKGNKFTWTT